MTDRYAVIGNPVAHSKSPMIHAEFARQTGHDISYDAIYAPLPEFEAAVARFRAEGGLGMNVTLPFKHRAYALAHERTQRAGLALAVNTLGLDSERISGDNTDGVGLIRDITVNLGFDIRGRRVLLMGAGGAAYGACGPLLDQSPATLTVVNRTVERAHALCAHFRDAHPRAHAITPAGYDALRGLEFDLVVNATSAGLSDALPPLPQGVFARDALAYDMVYGKTRFLDFAASAGARAADGLGLLVEQAAESFYIWRGVRPQTGDVLAKLRA